MCFWSGLYDYLLHSLPMGYLEYALRLVDSPLTVGEFEENIDSPSLSLSPPQTQSQSFHPTQTQSPHLPWTGEDHPEARA